MHAWRAPSVPVRHRRHPHGSLRPTGVPRQVLDDALRRPTERYRDAAVSRCLIEKPACQALLEAASTADLLVVGARRRRGHPGLQLGLVNHALLHHAPCPVAVVPQM
ncbi:universal stress protein [Streptomyces sp. NBC_00557]|uniref:universal stress protein n=1 Tax=Streptomyces sp. NBC_00557 TaxID=2975776 RepID=UPI002E81C439|nr:universal stress protein [Streptomyces sp. NBC_00557]